MKKISAAVLFFMVLSWGSGSAFAKPIPVRNQMPLYLFFLQMPPDKAETMEAGKFLIDADYTVSNITVSCFTPDTSLYDIDIDMEVSRVAIESRYGISDDLEIGLEVPYLVLSGGYLDNFVEGFEDGVGARTPRSRERQGSYEFSYSFIYNNQYLIQKNSSIDGLGDVALSAKYRLARESRILPNFSIRSSVKFPTGSEKDLLGSGEYDYGFGVLADKSFFERLFIYGGFNLIFIETPGCLSQLELDSNILSGMLAVEYFFTERASIVAQVSGNSTPYPSSDTTALDNDAYEFGLGFNYIWKEKKNVSWRFAIVENIKSASSPDVSFNTGLNIGF